MKNRKDKKLGKYKTKDITDLFPTAPGVNEITQEAIPEKELEKEDNQEMVQEMRREAIQKLRKARKKDSKPLIEHYEKQLKRLKSE